MFIQCFDKELKNKLIKSGFKLLKEDSSQATFLVDKNIKFNFDSVNKTKVLFTNKLTF